MVTNKVTYEFNRESRLLAPGQFQCVFNKKPLRFGSSHFTILVIPSELPAETIKFNNSKNTNSRVYSNGENNLYGNRLGLAIAKKRVKLAVQRNRIKRVVRESFRLNQDNLPPIDMVVMVKSGIDKLDNHKINQQLEKIWRKIIQRHKN
jgi:ribonuclease P protein component